MISSMSQLDNIEFLWVLSAVKRIFSFSGVFWIFFFAVHMGRSIVIPTIKRFNMCEDQFQKGKLHMLKYKLLVCMSDDVFSPGKV